MWKNKPIIYLKKKKSEREAKLHPQTIIDKEVYICSVTFWGKIFFLEQLTPLVLRPFLVCSEQRKTLKNRERKIENRYSTRTNNRLPVDI